MKKILILLTILVSTMGFSNLYAQSAYATINVGSADEYRRSKAAKSGNESIRDENPTTGEKLPMISLMVKRNSRTYTFDKYGRVVKNWWSSSYDRYEYGSYAVYRKRDVYSGKIKKWIYIVWDNGGEDVFELTHRSNGRAAVYVGTEEYMEQY